MCEQSIKRVVTLWVVVIGFLWHCALVRWRNFSLWPFIWNLWARVHSCETGIRSSSYWVHDWNPKKWPFQWKASEQYFLVILFIVLFKVILGCKTVRIFAYSSRRKQSKKGVWSEAENGEWDWDAKPILRLPASNRRFFRLLFRRGKQEPKQASASRRLILREKPTILQSNMIQMIHFVFCGWNLEVKIF